MSADPFFLTGKEAAKLDTKRVRDAVAGVLEFSTGLVRTTTCGTCKLAPHSLINAQMQRHMKSLADKTTTTLERWDGKTNTTLMTEVYFLLSVLEDNVYGLRGFAEQTRVLDHKAVALKSSQVLAPRIDALWEAVVAAFSPSEHEPGQLKRKARIVRMMSRNFTRSANQIGANPSPNSGGAPKASPKLKRLGQIDGVSKEDVKKDFEQYYEKVSRSGVGADFTPLPLSAEDLVNVSKLVALHPIGALALMKEGYKMSYYTATLHGISTAMGDQATAVDKKSHGAFKTLVSAGLLRTAAERLDDIDKELARNGVNYYEVLGLLRILLNTACSSKPDDLEDVQKKAYQELIDTNSHEYFYRELSCLSPEVAKLAKEAVKNIFGERVKDDSFEEGIHPLQIRPCTNPSCSKKEAKKGEFRKCGACRRPVYCSPECQRAHWPEHKGGCKFLKRLSKRST